MQYEPDLKIGFGRVSLQDQSAISFESTRDSRVLRRCEPSHLPTQSKGSAIYTRPKLLVHMVHELKIGACVYLPHVMLATDP